MNSGHIGEYYIIAELNRLGIRALISPDPSNQGWDIIVLKQNVPLKIQIKTLNWAESNRTITGDFEGDFDYLIVVILNFYKRTHYACFIIPKTELQRRPSNQKRGLFHINSRKLLFTNKTITFTTFAKKEIRNELNKRYRNKWHHFY